ncbi:unnamed protein product [Thelazia callipaeda]|uniref:Serine/arginine-rich splicing factor 2 n=1 Tax=Thelazia callipaeda TaxID=103827 RepID=A0A0N5CQ69_THECL|nr:unnamed protein product [Thelazia callipaeda]
MCTFKASHDMHFIMNVSLIAMARLHHKCRYTGKPYLRSNVYRVEVPDDKITWQICWPEYSPTDYTSLAAINKPWADSGDCQNHGKFKWNDIDGLVDRHSHLGIYALDETGRPLNPIGRTGLRGRGVLGRWGPNHAADPIVSRICHGELQFVGIARRDTGEWAIPGGMVDTGESLKNALKREFKEEALGGKDYPELDKLWCQGVELYRGYVDDPRNTDNAWIETVVVNYHDSEGYLNNIVLKAGDDAANLRWINASSRENLYASHADFVELLAKHHNLRPGPPSIDGLYSLKIDNISYQTAPQDLRRLFEKYGEIGDIHIPRDRYTKQSKGFGFVRFYSRRDAEYAMDRMDGRWVDGREIRVAMARYERPIDERSRNGGSYRRRSRSRSPRRRRSSSRSRSGSRYHDRRSVSRGRSGTRDRSPVSRRSANSDSSPPRHISRTPPPRDSRSPTSRDRGTTNIATNGKNTSY